MPQFWQVTSPFKVKRLTRIPFRIYPTTLHIRHLCTLPLSLPTFLSMLLHRPHLSLPQCEHCRLPLHTLTSLFLENVRGYYDKDVLSASVDGYLEGHWKSKYSLSSGFQKLTY